MTNTRTTALAATIALAIGACSSGSDDAASTTTQDLSGRPGFTDDTDPPATVDETPDTTPTTQPAPVDTTSATEPEPVDTAATSTVEEVSETTTAPADAAEAEVIEAVQFFEDQWKACLSAIPACDDAALSERQSPDAAINAQTTAQLYNFDGNTADNVEGLEYRVDGIEFSNGDNTATVNLCVTDPIVILAADGSIQNDTYTTSNQTLILTRQADTWFWESRVVEGDFVEGEANSICTT